MKILAALLLNALVVSAAAAQQQLASAPRDTGATDLVRIVAVVGDHPILSSEVEEIIVQRRAAGMPMPTDSAGLHALQRQVINELIDAEVLVQKARAENVEVSDADIQPNVEQQVRRLRSQFRTETEFTNALRSGGFGNQEEYRRWLMDQARRNALQQKLIAQLRRDGKLPPVPVSEEDVNAAFAEKKDSLPRRPATVTFRQIILPTLPSDKAREAARAKAESILVEIRRGGDFEQIARRESMDLSNKETGGDLGWNRRGAMVESFDRMMWALAPGQVSPVVETVYGFHIIRVDRAQPAEVKARHILIKPQLDSADVERTRQRADSVLALWQSGTSYDSLAARYHDPDEGKGLLEPYPRDSLPESYRTAFDGKGSGEFAGPFSIPDPSRGVPKFVVVQIIRAEEGGEYTINDVRTVLRDQLAQERAFRRLIDDLRSSTYVSIRL